jgi:hypothetical protein
MNLVTLGTFSVAAGRVGQTMDVRLSPHNFSHVCKYGPICLAGNFCDGTTRAYTIYIQNVILTENVETHLQIFKTAEDFFV